MPARLATLKDIDAYKALQLAELQEEHAEGGSVVLPTGRSLRFYTDYFHAYTTGSRFGVCALWHPEGDEEPAGFTLCGEPWEDWSYDTSLGRTAHIWGIYLVPQWRRRRAVLEMCNAGIVALRELGFETVQYNVLHGGRSQALADMDGAVPRGVWYTVDLRVMRSYEPPRG